MVVENWKQLKHLSRVVRLLWGTHATAWSVSISRHQYSHLQNEDNSTCLVGKACVELIRNSAEHVIRAMAVLTVSMHIASL